LDSGHSTSDDDVDEDAWKGQMTALGALIRSQRAMANLSLRDLAERTHVSNAYLSQVERGLHEPSIRVLHAIAAALGVSLDLMLAGAGLLPGGGQEAGGEARPSVPDTEAVIMADPGLTAAQKFALVSIYRSFRTTG
jgi:transcriptional regulator with XRE-family HTH domain